MPVLFGVDATIPTLVMHGAKELKSCTMPDKKDKSKRNAFLYIQIEELQPSRSGKSTFHETPHLPVSSNARFNFVRTTSKVGKDMKGLIDRLMDEKEKERLGGGEGEDDEDEFEEDGGS